MDRKGCFLLVVLIAVGVFSLLILGGLCYAGWWLSMRSVITPGPKREIVYQRFTQTLGPRRTLELGFINADGTGERVQAVLFYGTYTRDTTGRVAKDPFRFYPYFGFLGDGRPYVHGGGQLVLFHLPEWERVPCGYDLAWRPYPVGNSGAWVGEYQWAEEGGILLFWPDRPNCPKEDLWSRRDLKDLGVLRLAHSLDEVGFIRVTAFHHQNDILIFGQGIHRWSLETRRLESWGEWITDCSYGELSYDDAYLACLHAEKEGVYLRVWDLQNRRMWRERLIRAPWIPQYGIEVSWSPDDTCLVYHRCVQPDPDTYPACELKGDENLGIYVWDLEQNEERLLTRHGVMPFWIQWEK